MAEWHRVGTVSEIRARTLRRIRVGLRWIALHEWDGRIHAIDDVCPHRGATLSNGCVTADGFVECPEHGWEYHLVSGQGREEWEGCIERFDVRQEGDDVFVLVPPPQFLPR